MSNIAVWTDSNGRVGRLHHQPSEVDTSGAHVTEKSPPDSNTADWVEDSLHYDEAQDSFYYVSEDPFDGLNFTDAEKKNVFDAVQQNDLVEIRNIVEQALQA